MLTFEQISRFSAVALKEGTKKILFTGTSV
jgi:molybdenum cofactor biosynthesis enzyme MoaA